MKTSDWPDDDMLLEFAAATTPAQRLEWLEAALDFANTVGALRKTLWLEAQHESTSGPARSEESVE